MADYRASNGKYYSDKEVWEHLENEEWSICCWDEETGKEWVITEDDRLVCLIPTDHQDAII